MTLYTYTLKCALRHAPPFTTIAADDKEALEHAELIFPGRGPWTIVERRWPESVILDNDAARDAIASSLVDEEAAARRSASCPEQQFVVEGGTPPETTRDRLRAHLEVETEGQWSPAWVAARGLNAGAAIARDRDRRLTEDDVRRIVREELERIEQERAGR